MPAGRQTGAVVSVKPIPHPSVADRKALGEEARRRIPPASHAGWQPAADRADPVDLLEEQNVSREPDLIPVRHGRMMVSPFTFYRGAAKVMAADLRETPRAGLAVQLCGDAHLLNFGVFASPERQLLFDLNDFDETLPGPFEYDVKRMAASFTIAARNNGFAEPDARDITLACVSAYREAMAGFAGMRTLDIWYARLSEDDLMRTVRSTVAEATAEAKKAKGAKKAKKEAKEAKEAVKAAEKSREKAHTRDSLQALAKLAEKVDGQYRIISDPPVLIPSRDLPAQFGLSAEEARETIRDQLRRYRATLQPDRRHLLEQFQVVDVARKVVGVGSVGTRAFIALLQGRDSGDPLFLQVKEATASVLEDHLPRSRFRQPGERVVQGQRLMQAASDIFLGWTKGRDVSRYFYWRQLRDMKGSARVESMTAPSLAFYGRTCGWTLARAHARSGDPVAICAYLGGGDEFDRAIADFSARYADRNEQDYAEFVKAIRAGKLPALEGV
jgi:uncharacterized protein (DUF2252 family)